MLSHFEIEVTQRQAEILVEYAHPFDEEAEQLQSFIAKPGYHYLKTDDFYAPRLIADLVCSAKSIGNDALLDEFDELITIIEMAIERGDHSIR